MINKFKVDFTKDDLKAGDIVTLRNGERLIYAGNDDFEDLNPVHDNNLCAMSDLKHDLSFCDSYDSTTNKDWDIVKVERPVTYNNVFERQEEVKEMTIAEISEALGYEVKIVKEDK